VSRAVRRREDARIYDVLLVEDNPGDVRLVREVITETDQPVELHVAVDGETAMDWLRGRDGEGGARPPDLLLLDLNLPRKGGLEVLAELKSDPRLRHIPVIVLTSSAADRDVRGAYERQANCFVTKPLGLDDFIETVRDIAGFWLRAVELPRP
jgi:CheY-like chemotaxis protein